MIQAYRDLLARFDHYGEPHVYLTLQSAFLFYLLLGQLVALLVWRLLAARRGNGWFAGYLLLAQVALLLAWPPLIGAWQIATPTFLADVVVTFHVALVLAVVVLLVLILVGWPLGWTWTRNFWLRLVQLLIIEVVAGQAIVGIECPLKTLERMLRFAGGAESLHELTNASAIGRFSNELLYYQANPVVFMSLYAMVALLVLATWFFVPPRLPWAVKAEESATKKV